MNRAALGVLVIVAVLATCTQAVESFNASKNTITQFSHCQNSDCTSCIVKTFHAGRCYDESTNFEALSTKFSACTPQVVKQFTYPGSASCSFNAAPSGLIPGKCYFFGSKQGYTKYTCG